MPDREESPSTEGEGLTSTITHHAMTNEELDQNKDALTNEIVDGIMLHAEKVGYPVDVDIVVEVSPSSTSEPAGETVE